MYLPAISGEVVEASGGSLIRLTMRLKWPEALWVVVVLLAFELETHSRTGAYSTLFLLAVLVWHVVASTLVLWPACQATLRELRSVIDGRSPET